MSNIPQMGHLPTPDDFHTKGFHMFQRQGTAGPKEINPNCQLSRPRVKAKAR